MLFSPDVEKNASEFKFYLDFRVPIKQRYETLPANGLRPVSNEF